MKTRRGSRKHYGVFSYQALIETTARLKIDHVYHAARDSGMDQHIPEVDGIGCDVLVVYAHHQDARYDYGNQLSSAQRDFRNMVLDFHCQR